MLYIFKVLRSFVVRLIAVAALGSVIGPCGELIHFWAGVWVLDGRAFGFWWIPGIYFVALIGVGLLFRRIGKIFHSRPTRSALFIEIVIVVALFLAPPLLHTQEIVLAVLALAYVVVRLIFFRVRGDLLIAVLVPCLDLVIEAILVSVGMFQYTHAMFWSLPIWLPFLWAGLGLSLYRLLNAALSS